MKQSFGTGSQDTSPRFATSYYLYGSSLAIPIPDIDLGEAAGGLLTGTATVGLAWSKLDDDGFERLLHDLLRDISDYDNVQWLTKTRAPDRGRADVAR
jgi:hypothetical protein